MGLFNLPGPLYDLVDRAVFAAAPAPWRLVFWAVVAAVSSLLIYKWLSPQAKIAATKERVAELRRRMLDHDGEDLASAMPLIRAQLAIAFRHLGLVLPATLIASLPALTLMIWLDTSYARFLPDSAPFIEVVPAGFEGTWRTEADVPRITVRERTGQAVADIPVQKPIPQIEKRHWWNVLLGNPAGYLPDHGPVERVTVHLPEQAYLPFGPGWARSWMALFIPVFFVTSLFFYRIARIQ
ncbi:hypothetical protein [Shumkonia mesophila]|uniref:hypothetical protein n=1 Tax=Shumkonia mesophila TaxID=2838854 RepID=UPI00293497A6|nr:hypothetical protein [Shumkonia mesophila]